MPFVATKEGSLAVDLGIAFNHAPLDDRHGKSLENTLDEVEDAVVVELPFIAGPPGMDDEERADQVPGEHEEDLGCSEKGSVLAPTVFASENGSTQETDYGGKGDEKEPQRPKEIGPVPHLCHITGNIKYFHFAKVCNTYNLPKVKLLGT